MSNVLSCTILPYPSNRTNIPLGPWCAAQSKNTWWCWMKTPPHPSSEHLADTNQPAGTSSSSCSWNRSWNLLIGFGVHRRQSSSIPLAVTSSSWQRDPWSLIRHRNCWFQSGHSHLVVESLGRRGNRARCCCGLSDSLRCLFGHRVLGCSVFIVVARRRWFRLYICSWTFVGNYDSEKSWVRMKLCRTNELILVSRRRYWWTLVNFVTLIRQILYGLLNVSHSFTYTHVVRLACQSVD